MTAAAVIARALQDGVTLSVDPAGKLKVRGDQAAVARWLPEVREAKAELLAVLTDTEPRRLWLIALPDGSQFSSSFCPPATLAEVRSWYPGAVIEPEQDQADTDAPAALVPVDEPAAVQRQTISETRPALVSCRTCGHWRPDQIGDGSGLGRCLADAPASHLPGSCWPWSAIHCRRHQGVTP